MMLAELLDRWQAMAARLLSALALAVIVSLSADSLAESAAPAVTPLFDDVAPVALRLEAPFNELFEHARTDDSYAVSGTLSYTHAGRAIKIENVKLTLRGHTSR